MGGAQSTEQSQYGFHVLKVKENSPAFHAGIEQFFDYIVTINGELLSNGDSQLLLKTLQEFEGKPLPMGIYSSKDQQFREVTLIPSRDWHPNDPNEKSLIGCSIRFCSFEKAGENVWHVLDVSPNSPAEMAGIIPYSDYIIGSPHMTLRNEDDFYNLVEEYLGKPLRLYLYNSEWDSCRECIIVPNHEWGGNGSLGCDVGYGLLHRIPRRKNVDTEESGHSHHTDSNSYIAQDGVNSPSISSNTTTTQQEQRDEANDKGSKNRSNSVNYSDTIFNAPDYQQPEEEEEVEEEQPAEPEHQSAAINNDTTEPPTEEMDKLNIDKDNDNDERNATSSNHSQENDTEAAVVPAEGEQQKEEKEEDKDTTSDDKSSSNDKDQQN